MQIKARYLGQIARYTTIVLTAWENLSEEPVLISFNTIYIGEKKIKSLHPPLKWKNNPWVTDFSNAINQCKAGSEELTEEAMAHLKHLAAPYKAKACTKLWHLGCAPRSGPRSITDPESQHIQTPMKKAFSGLGILLGTSSLWSPALPTSKMHNAAGLTGDPRRVAWPKGFHTHENHQLKPLSAWQCSSTWKKNSLQNKLQPTVREKKNPPANHQSQHSAWCFTPTLTSVLSPTGKHVWSSYLASRWRLVSARFLSTELG